MKYTHLIVHYSEIGIKKGNRHRFERQLIDNINLIIEKYLETVEKRYGVIICVLKKDLKKEDYLEIKSKISKVIGLSFFAFAKMCDKEVPDLISKSLEYFEEINQKENIKTFRVSARRSNKAFELTSQEINVKIGAEIVRKFNKKVNLENPDFNLHLEITEKQIFIYHEKHPGIRGLPIGSSGTVICSLSGGIDSPVAAYQLMKRGCKVVFVHMLPGSVDSGALKNKIFKLCEKLTVYQNKITLYLIPFTDLQKQIISYVPSDYRMIVYRRIMFKIINKIIRYEKAKAIVTGDSVGQVASQTLDNLHSIYEAALYPVLAPLISFNKEEIIAIAKEIDTYDTSILPYPDCCSFLVDNHPQTRAELECVKSIEKNIIDLDNLIKETLSKKEKYTITYKDYKDSENEN